MKEFRKTHNFQEGERLEEVLLEAYSNVRSNSTNQYFDL